jgi:hypothetical protein
LLQLLRVAPVAQELCHLLGEYGEAGLEIVAALVDVDMAGATEENFQSLLYFFGSDLIEGDEADVALRFKQLLWCGFGLAVLVLNVAFHMNYI